MSFQPSSSQGKAATEKHESEIGPGAVLPVAVLSPPIKHNESDALVQKAGSEGDTGIKKAEAKQTASAIKPYIGPIIVGVALLIGVAFVWNKLTSLRNHHQQQVVGQERVQGNPASKQPRFSLSHFAQLRDGMTYAEVCKILGDNGVDRLRSNSAKFVGWENSDGSFIQVGFHDEKVTSLLQIGLK